MCGLRRNYFEFVLQYSPKRLFKAMVFHYRSKETTVINRLLVVWCGLCNQACLLPIKNAEAKLQRDPQSGLP